MKTRSQVLIILLIIVIALVDTSLAFWDGGISITNNNLKESGKLSVGQYNYGTPSGANDFDKDKNGPSISYGNGDIYFDPDNGLLYEAVQGCTSSGDYKCQKPNDPYWPNKPQNGYNSLFKTITHLWTRSNLFSNGDIVVQDGRVFKVWDAGTANGTNNIPVQNRKGWYELSTIIFNKDYFYPSGSLLIIDNKLYRIKRDHHSGNNTFCPKECDPFENYVPNRTDAYKVNEAVVFNGNVYSVIDAQLANKHAPNEVPGAWYKHGDLNWNINNVYKKDDIVKHRKDSQSEFRYYRAVNDKTTAEPNTQANTWSSLETGGFIEFNTYLRGQYVIFGNVLYKCTAQVSGVKPTDPTGALFWKRV